MRTKAERAMFKLASLKTESWKSVMSSRLAREQERARAGCGAGTFSNPSEKGTRGGQEMDAWFSPGPCFRRGKSSSLGKGKTMRDSVGDTPYAFLSRVSRTKKRATRERK